MNPPGSLKQRLTRSAVGAPPLPRVEGADVVLPVSAQVGATAMTDKEVVLK